MPRTIGVYWPEDLEEDGQKIMTRVKLMAKERFGLKGLSRFLHAIDTGELVVDRKESALAKDLRDLLDKHS